MGRIVHVTFLDIQREFDALPHNIVLQRLVRSGVQGKALANLKIFLSGWFFCVKFGGDVNSTPLDSQGSQMEAWLAPCLLIAPWQPYLSTFPCSDFLLYGQQCIWTTLTSSALSRLAVPLQFGPTYNGVQVMSCPILARLIGLTPHQMWPIWCTGPTGDFLQCVEGFTVVYDLFKKPRRILTQDS